MTDDCHLNDAIERIQTLADSAREMVLTRTVKRLAAHYCMSVEQVREWISKPGATPGWLAQDPSLYYIIRQAQQEMIETERPFVDEIVRIRVLSLPCRLELSQDPQPKREKIT